VVLRNAGQPSNPDSIITDFKKVLLEEFYREFLPVMQLQPFPDK
jgi:hypothetical protein